jgi:hypothetical protein
MHYFDTIEFGLHWFSFFDPYMHFFCFATSNKRTRVDKMSIYPLEQKVIKSNVLKKRNVVQKYAILKRMSLETTEHSLDSWFMPLCILWDFKISLYVNSYIDKLFRKRKTVD